MFQNQPKNSLASVALVFILALSITACGGDEPLAIQESKTPIVVTLATPSGAVDGGIAVSGKLQSKQTADISTRIMGHITKMHVQVGDRVHRGQTLVSIAAKDIQAKRMQTDAAISEAEAHVASAQKDFERFNNLYKKQSATAKELENVTLQYNAAKARLEAARQMRNEVNAQGDYIALSAPFDGVVTARMADDGDMANPGMPLLTIEQAGTLQVSTTVSESEIGALHKGAKAHVQVKAINKMLDAMITEISPSAQMTGGQYEVKMSIIGDKTGLYSGMYVQVFIPINKPMQSSSSNTVVVPAKALVHKDELVGLYTVSANNTAILRWVRTGKTVGDQVEILSGLAAGESYVLEAASPLYNGAPLQIKK